MSSWIQLENVHGSPSNDLLPWHLHKRRNLAQCVKRGDFNFLFSLWVCICCPAVDCFLPRAVRTYGSSQPSHADSLSTFSYAPAVQEGQGRVPQLAHTFKHLLTELVFEQHREAFVLLKSSSPQDPQLCPSEERFAWHV